MSKQELEQRYLDIINQIDGDEELMLKVLIEQVGGVEKLWNAMNTHVTSLNEIYDLSDETALEEISNLEAAFNTVLTQSIEEEFLTERIDTIAKTETGYKLFLENGKEVEITDTEVKEKIFLQNNELAFDHFAGLMEESDVLEVFRIVDLFYVE